MKTLIIIYTVDSNGRYTISFHGKTLNEAAVLAANWVSRNSGIVVLEVK